MQVFWEFFSHTPKMNHIRSPSHLNSNTMTHRIISNDAALTSTTNFFIIHYTHCKQHFYKIFKYNIVLEMNTHLYIECVYMTSACLPSKPPTKIINHKTCSVFFFLLSFSIINFIIRVSCTNNLVVIYNKINNTRHHHHHPCHLPIDLI